MVDPDKLIVSVPRYELDARAQELIGKSLPPEKMNALKALAGKQLSGKDLQNRLELNGFDEKEIERLRALAKVTHVRRIVSDRLKRSLDYKLYRAVQVTPDIRYIYTLTWTDKADWCKFILASDDCEREEIDPEETYYDVRKIPELRSRSAFSEPVATESFYRDMWGTWLSGYAPLRDEAGRVIAVVGADISAARVAEYQDEMKYWVLGVFAACVLVSIIISLVVSDSISTPLLRIAEHTKALSAGDFSAKIDLKTGGELKVLCEAFNTMAGRLETLFANLHQTQAQLIRYTDELKDSNRRLNRKVSELTSLYIVSQAMNRNDDVD
jgi:HAMP domain-containing protein